MGIEVTARWSQLDTKTASTSKFSKTQLLQQTMAISPSHESNHRDSIIRNRWGPGPVEPPGESWPMLRVSQIGVGNLNFRVCSLLLRRPKFSGVLPVAAPTNGLFCADRVKHALMSVGMNSPLERV